MIFFAFYEIQNAFILLGLYFFNCDFGGFLYLTWIFYYSSLIKSITKFHKIYFNYNYIFILRDFSLCHFISCLIHEEFSKLFCLYNVITEQYTITHLLWHSVFFLVYQHDRIKHQIFNSTLNDLRFWTYSEAL